MEHIHSHQGIISQSLTINTELMKYLEEAKEKCKAEDNYFEGCDKATSTLPEVQQVFHYEGTDDTPLEENAPNKKLESIEEDTGSILENDNTWQDDQLSTISEASHEDEDPADQDTLIFDDGIDYSDNEHFDRQ